MNKMSWFEKKYEKIGEGVYLNKDGKLLFKHKTYYDYSGKEFYYNNLDMEIKAILSFGSLTHKFSPSDNLASKLVEWGLGESYEIWITRRFKELLWEKIEKKKKEKIKIEYAVKNRENQIKVKLKFIKELK